MPIRQLSQSLINKIAAGEVIERPASVVKELMENAIDAGATRIDVLVIQGGLEMVRVTDNGGGISAEELPLALASHATSKIMDADDLFRVGTLGFRGEALASIAEVSRLVLRSRTPNSSAGAEIEAAAGVLGGTAPCGCPVGTTVEVHNLFYNTPVRRKFLRASTTEFGHVSEAFTRIALAAPSVHFTLRHNDKQVFDLPAGNGWLERIALLFGRDLAEQLIWVESIDGEVKLAGYAAHPAQNRSHNRMQYFFLNGRYIRDRALQHALTEAYRGLLTVGRQPIAFMSMTMPPEMVDVNVHPTKLEVRFQDSGRLYSQLLGTLRAKFLTTDLSTHVSLAGGQSADNQADQLRQQVVDWAKGKMADWGSANQAPLPCLPTAGVLETHPLHQVGQDALPATSDRPTSALQVHNRYLVAETDEGVTIIDQHALHERILYEQLRRRLSTGQIDSQQLLVPETVDLSPSEMAAALEHRDLLAELGMKIELFGGNTLLIVGYPAALANIPPTEVLRALLERIIEGAKQPDRRDLFDDLLHTIACKAAIKAGDKLTPEEITSLLQQRHLIDDAHHCPHGRPTALVFTREELDRRFKRL